MKQLILMVGVLFSLLGCLDDQTKMGKNPISYLSFTTELDSLYYAERTVAFTIDAPEMKQENEEKPLSYEWQINYKVVSTEKTLKYASDTCGLFPCRLKIYNEDGAIFQKFNLRVPYPYDEGILILSKYDGHSIISFRNDNLPERGFEKDVYALSNPRVPLGKEPVAIACSPTSLFTPYIFVVTENPFKLLKLNYHTMEVLDELAYPEKKIGRLFEKNYKLYFMGDGRTVNYGCQHAFFSNYFQQNLTGKEGAFPNAKLSDEAVVYGQEYYENLLVYDMENQILVSSMNAASPQPIKHGETVVEVEQMYNMLIGVKDKEVLLLLKDKRGENKVVYLNMDEKYNDSWQKVPVFDFKSIYTIAGINARSKFASSRKESILYYTIGNEIYRYNYLSAGNFPTKSDYTVGATGSIIKKMVLNDTKSELYVAIDSPNGEYKGAVYCYHIDTKELLWKEEGVAGEIVEMLYKPRNSNYKEDM